MFASLHNSKGQALIGMAIALTVVVGTLLTVEQVRSVQATRNLVRNLDSEEGYYASELALAYAYSTLQDSPPDASVDSTAINSESELSAIRNLPRVGGGITYRFAKSAAGPDQYCGTIHLPQSVDRELCMDVDVPAVPPALVLTANGTGTTYTKGSAQAVTIAWSATGVRSCVDPFGGSELSGSVSIPDDQLRFKTVYALKCLSPSGPVETELTVLVPGRWYQANMQYCPTFCTNIGLDNGPAPDGPSCGSGEVRVPSMAGLSYPYGAWGSGLPLNWVAYSYGIYCYTNGQRHDNDWTDVTIGCFCKSDKVLLGNPAVLTVTANNSATSYTKVGNEPVTIAWTATGDITSCTDPFGGASMNGNLEIQHADLRSTKTYTLRCQTRIGTVTAKVVVNVIGRWYQTDRQECQSVCAEQELENVESNDGSYCASGVVDVGSAVWQPINFTYGRSSNKFYDPPRNNPPKSTGQFCYEPNWVQVPGPISYTVGCFCK